MNARDRGVLFEWLCVFYLQIAPVYRISYKSVLHSSQFLRQRRIKQILGLSKNREEGVDAIAERFDGKLDIIQCKYLDNENKNLTKTHIASALEVAEGREAKKHIDTVLMCSNAKGLTRNADLQSRHPDIQLRIVSGAEFRQLTADDFTNIRKVIDDSVPRYSSKSPRAHQANAVSKTLGHLSSHSRGQLIHACGTGKTLTSYFIYRELKPNLCVFAVPSLQLINQTLIEWSVESLADDNPISPFVVCSDKSNEKVGEMEPTLWLQELGIKVSSDKLELEDFLSSRRPNKVIFTTYQSGRVFAENFATTRRKVDLAFFDEAHNTVTSKSKPYSHLLFDENIPIKKRVFMTATPKRLVGKSDTLLSMDDTEVYGDVIDEITVKDAIEGVGGLQLLNDYKIVTQLINVDSYRELLDENPFVVDEKALPEATELKLLAAALTLKKVRKDMRIKHTVSFHGRRNRARAFQKGVSQLDRGMNTFYVDGKQSGAERLGVLEDFTSTSPSLVTNAQCLSEGVNVPAIDAVMFVDPKQSRIDITQAIGRALRKGGQSKGLSYIIIPVNIDESRPEAVEEAYQQILMVLRSMSEHDGRIIEYFRMIKEGKKPPRKFLEVRGENLSENIDLTDFEQQLHFKAWSRVAKLGRRPFDQAREFAQSLELGGYSEWLEFMCSEQAPADIPVYPDQSYREWTDWRDFLGNPSLEEEFDELIREYKEFAKGKQIPFPRDQEVTASGYKLGLKVRGMENSYKRGQLPAYKVQRVQTDLIDKDIYSWDGRDDWVWRKQYSAYAAELAKDSDFAPKKRGVYNGWRLELWETQQKIKYRTLKGEESARKLAPLKDWQLEALQAINFSFEGRKDAQWDRMFTFWQETAEIHDGKIPNLDPATGKPYECQGQNLKGWISKQRSRRDSLTVERVERLSAEPHWSWDPFDDAFKKNFEVLSSFQRETGIANPRQKEQYKGVKIGSFATQMRDKYRKGKLDEDKVDLLRSIGFTFD